MDWQLFSGEVYLIWEYNEKGQLLRVVKMYRREVFFEYNYSYHGNGRLKSARVAGGGWRAAGGRGSWSGTSAGARLKGSGTRFDEARRSGAMRQHRTRNLEIPGSRLRRAPE